MKLGSFRLGSAAVVVLSSICACSPHGGPAPNSPIRESAGTASPPPHEDLSPGSRQLAGLIVTALASSLDGQPLPSDTGVVIIRSGAVDAELSALGQPRTVLASFIDIHAAGLLEGDVASEITLRLILFPDGRLRWGSASLRRLEAVTSPPNTTPPASPPGVQRSAIWASYSALWTEGLHLLSDGCSLPFTQIRDLRAVPMVLHSELFPDAAQTIAAYNGASTLQGVWNIRPGVVGEVLRAGNRLLLVGGPVRLQDNGRGLEVGPIRALRVDDTALRVGFHSVGDLTPASH